MPLSSCRIIAAYNRYASGVRAALPELIVIYEPLPITTRARHYATRGSITTATLPFGCGLPNAPAIAPSITNHQPGDYFKAHCGDPSVRRPYLSAPAAVLRIARHRQHHHQRGTNHRHDIGRQNVLMSGGSIARACRAASGKDCAQTPISAPMVPSLTDHVFQQQAGMVNELQPGIFAQ